MPREVFVAGQVLTAAELNVVSDQSVMVFAGTAARGSAIPSPTEGMVTYREDDDVVEVYNGSSFVAVGRGQILQVVSTTKTDTFSTSSTSFTPLTGLSVSITPSDTNNKVLILLTLQGGADGSASNGAQFRMKRDATDIALGDASSSRTQVSLGNMTLPYTRASQQLAINFLDSPSTTSSVTYSVDMRMVDANTGYINRSANDSDSALSFRSVSNITVMEVAG